ncbi:TonB-dependent receptor plug domain-containing protein [Lysobacter sp. CA199]|uniref:TonB-dependent receptor plug domain-containing protein n=1 Tax=Lysobacter sp. CA199 TaxID=3455608 RepID=UPI003F8D1F4E
MSASFRPLSRRTLPCAIAMLLCGPAMGQQAAPAPAQNKDDDKAKTLDAVTVTGSRIKRAEIEGPAPVTVITGEQIRKEGFSTAYEALLTLTGNTAVSDDSGWGQSDVNSSKIDLRGLGPGRTLQLINGHRVADYPMPAGGKSNFANYNNIPSGIIDRIEILSGSASAIYGSDAMGGVVNIITKKKFEGQQLRVKYGEATRGGSDNLDVVFSGGLSGTNWNVVYNLQHFDRGVLMAKSRPFMDDEGDKDYEKTWDPGERHYNQARLDYYPGIRLSNTEVTLSPTSLNPRIAPPPGACDRFGDLLFETHRYAYDRNSGVGTDAGAYCAQRVFYEWNLRTGSKDDSAYVYGDYDFSDTLKGWASATVWKSTGSQAAFPPQYSSPEYWDANAQGSRSFTRVLSSREVGGQDNLLTQSEELSIDVSAGLSGKMFGDRFDWDLMIDRAQYSIKEDFPVIDPATSNRFFLGPRLGTYAHPTKGDLPIYAPDYDGRLWTPLSRENVSEFYRTGRKKARSWLSQATFTVSGDLFEGWAGPVGFAGALEAARQGYKLTPDPRTLGADAIWQTPFGNVETGGGDRSRYAAGVEFSIPLAKSLLLNVAGRYDKYDAVSSDAATTYQVGLEWRPFDNLLVRGSYGTAFRAPDMHFVYADPSQRIVDYIDLVPCYQSGRSAVDCGRQTAGDPYYLDDYRAVRQGARDLKYEEGESLSAGFVWDAFEGFSISADYWRIRIDNLIDDISANQTVEDDAWCRTGLMPNGLPRTSPVSPETCAVLARRIVRDANGRIAYVEEGPINRTETRTSGVDLSATYSFNTAIGRFAFALDHTYLLTYETRQYPQDPLDDQQPTRQRSKLNLRASWNYRDWDATLFMTQKSGGRVNNWNGCRRFADGYMPSSSNDCVDTDTNSPTFGQRTERVYGRRPTPRYVSGSVGYQINDALKLNVYVNNVFDKIYRDNWCGGFSFCVDDPVGREVAAEVVYKFD